MSELLSKEQIEDIKDYIVTEFDVYDRETNVEPLVNQAILAIDLSAQLEAIKAENARLTELVNVYEWTFGKLPQKEIDKVTAYRGKQAGRGEAE